MTIEYAVADEAFCRQRLQEHEDEFELDSFEFYRLHKAWEVPWKVPPHDCVVWASWFRRWKKERRFNGLPDDRF